ncbi:uncharacterized protein LOC112054753 [Bicyclus anynana]|uniref:Uncharacterized protein LOC112054753 n=1 Tax=Bicyclus anynana TaxID=110368 RepID=A0A6J1NYQ0_BICAN|nr:uncharacterized protein LOC112054753 [Bicyclus anynana]
MDCVTFKVNGEEHSVGSDVSSTTTLLEYLRTRLELRGTKYMCLEGGCGACIVSVVKCPGSNMEAVNSCLVSVTSCQGWEVSTIEHVGNRLKGYHPLQTTLAGSNGSQCGYCSPGWVMSMYSLLDSKPTMLEVERSLSSNICRCTGYRPILEAFRKFASDCPDEAKLADIEDLQLCTKTKETCSKECDDREWCLLSKDALEDIVRIKLKDGRQWFGVCTVADIFNVLRTEGRDSYMLVAGNTGKGVIPILEYPRILIDVSRVSELKGYLVDQNLVVGAGTTLTKFREILEEASHSGSFAYLSVLNDHLDLVAHVAVRNLGTIAGNLMLKHQNNKFASDIFVLFQAIGAKITLALAPGVTKVVTLKNFLVENMIGKLILNIVLPPLSRNNRLVTYKIAARSRNAPAIVNAVFIFRYKSDNLARSCRIVYGGLSPNFSRARNTEKSLIGKNLFQNAVLQEALRVLSKELIVTENPPEPSARYRKQLAIGLFYKALLSLCPKNIIHPRYMSGAGKIHDSRPISKGTQVFETNQDLWPLNQPIQKIEALIQCAGESEYAEDVPSMPREVFAVFVLSDVALGTIENIDASEALKQPGVVAFYSAKDIPGVNAFTSDLLPFIIKSEELLCSGDVLYFNQPIGIIVAETNYMANRAATMVKVKYCNVRKPEIDVKLNKNNPNKTKLYRAIQATKVGNNVIKVIKGNHTVYGQNYFCLETLNCTCKPTEDGLILQPSSHYVNCDHLLTSRCLNIEESRIEVKSHRLGGSFGLKQSRQSQISVACSLVAYKLNRPCRFITPLRTQTRAIGKRMPASTDFEVGVNAEGVIQFINYDIYNDNGCDVAELIIEVILVNYFNCYNKEEWNFKCYTVITDTASNSWFRSPGIVETVSATEMIIERIAYELDLDPIDVRLKNLDKKNHNDLAEMFNTLKVNSDYEKRRYAVDKFNMENRWRKRGLRFTFMKWSAALRFVMNVIMSVYIDGTVAITHGGVEVGQGINTKAAQICAYFLNIPINKIHIKPYSTTTHPNNSATSASFTSQNVGIGVQRCCEELLKRLEPVKAQMKNPLWEQLIGEAFKLGVNLQTNSFVGFNDTNTENTIYGVTLAEVEIDILTGQWEILRVDLMEDVGRSVSPSIDIGQVEGAFIMGVGYWTTEELVYDQCTGELLTDRTSNYYVPQGTDIPQDFRIYFRQKSYSSDKVLGSKAVGEPPTCMGVAVPIAMREAIASARSDGGIPTTKWFQIDGPYTVEKLCLACETNIEDMKYF